MEAFEDIALGSGEQLLMDSTLQSDILWSLTVLQWKIPSCDAKSIFSIDHHCKKRDVCKIFDRTPHTAEKVNYESVGYECLIHGCFVFVKVASS